jgi:hypothetical protein
MPRPTNPLKAVGNRFEQSRALVALFDEQQRLLYINPAALAFLGVAAETVLSEPAVYCSPAIASQPLAAISPPPDAFEGHVRTALLYPNARTESHQVVPAFFLPLAVNATQHAVLMVAGVPTTACSDPLWQVLAGGHYWHEELQKSLVTPRVVRQPASLLGQTAAMKLAREQIQLAGSATICTCVVSPTLPSAEAVVKHIQHERQVADADLILIDCALQDAATFAALFRNISLSRKPLIWLKDVEQLAPAVQTLLLDYCGQGAKPYLVATTTRKLSHAVRKQKFSPSLAAELSVLNIIIPPLSKRVTDIPLLAQWCVESFNASAERTLNGVLPATLEYLVTYAWPGDVLEFVQVLNAACQNTSGAWVAPNDLPEQLRSNWQDWVHPRRREEPLQLDSFLAEIETELLRRALEHSRGNKSKAAKLLGISRPRLLRRLVQLGLAPAAEEKIDFQPLDEGESP